MENNKETKHGSQQRIPQGGNQKGNLKRKPNRKPKKETKPTFEKGNEVTR